MSLRATDATAPGGSVPQDRAFLLVLLAIYVVNLALRLPGALQELPPYTFCDEDIFTHASYEMYRAHDWRPQHFFSGGINFYASIVGAHIYELVVGTEPNFRAFVIVARVIGPIGLGAMLPVFLMLAMREITRHNSAVFWAAVVGTFSPLALGISRVAYPDHSIAAPAAAVLWLSIKAAQERQVAIWVFGLAGAFVGLLTSLKYSGILLAALFAAAYVLTRTAKELLRPWTWVGPIVSAAAAIAVFVATNPLVVVEPELFLNALQWQQGHYAGGHPGLEAANGYLFYAEIIFFGSFGVAGVLAVASGIYATFRCNAPLTLSLVGLLVLFIIWMGGYSITTNRNVMVVLPIALLFIALGIATLLDRLPGASRAGGIAQIAVIVLLCAEPGWRVGVQLKNDFQRDARAAAARWIAENVPAGEAVGYGPTCWAVPFNEKRNPIVKIDLPKGKNICLRHFVMESWQYEHWGKGNDPITWPNVSEQMHVNIGGVNYRERRQALDDFLKPYVIRKAFMHNSYYGPAVYVFERAHACPY